MTYDRIIIGAGLYGLYCAEFCGKRGERVLVLEADDTAFKRATWINQARVHMGYHYPRSYSTAIKSAGYFRRFDEDYGFCEHKSFEQIYATSAAYSWTNATEFERFCKAAEIRCDNVSPEKYFNPGLCDGAFLTEEYTYDAQVLKKHFLEQIALLSNVTIRYASPVEDIYQRTDHFEIRTAQGETYETDFLINATYAGVNTILQKLEYEPFRIKYELCEIILCTVSDQLKDIGITVMDGPFFSIMPFGQTGLHSLTSVTFTPHSTSYDTVPKFACQKKAGALCKDGYLGNCNDCPHKPHTAWDYISQLARKYLKEEYGFAYQGSLFSMKPILKASEIDDSRPTVIKTFSTKPTFVSVLSGKINTVYDMEEVLTNGRD